TPHYATCARPPAASSAGRESRTRAGRENAQPSAKCRLHGGFGSVLPCGTRSAGASAMTVETRISPSSHRVSTSMHRFRFGLMLERFDSAEHVVELARQAEASGF